MAPNIVQRIESIYEAMDVYNCLYVIDSIDRLESMRSLLENENFQTIRVSDTIEVERLLLRSIEEEPLYHRIILCLIDDAMDTPLSDIVELFSINLILCDNMYVWSSIMPYVKPVQSQLVIITLDNDHS